MRPADLALIRKREILRQADGSLQKMWADVKALREKVRHAEGKQLH
jgi:Ni2+-binding GTPase involved in maturation of urease and hydrogenase